MNRFALFFWLLAAFPAAQAQFHIGPKVEAGLSSLSVDEPNLNTRSGFSWGFGGFARFGETLYVQPEVLFVGRNMEFTFDNPSGGDELESSVRFNSVEVPIKVGLRLIPTDKANLRVFGGPTFGFITNYSEDSDQGVEFSNDWYRKTNVGAQVGAGMDLIFLTVDLSYDFGLTDLNNTDNTDPNNFQNPVRSNIFRLGVGFKIL